MPLYTHDELGISVTDIVAVDGKETRNSGRKNAVDKADMKNLYELNVRKR